MIKIDANHRTVRTTSAPFQFSNGNGEIQTEQITVRYYSLKIKDIKARRAALEQKAKDDPTAIVWLSETLAESLESLPDLTDEKGKPLAITVENLDAIDLPNLEAIKKAIDDDISGKAQPDK